MGLPNELRREVERLIEQLKTYIDDRIESLCGQRIRNIEAGSDAMSKPSVEALVKTMLGPIEDRLSTIESHFRLRDIEARVKFYPASVDILKSELERLRRIEEAAIEVEEWLLAEIPVTGNVAQKKLREALES